MVDLVKVRKKAKEKKSPQPSGLGPPASGAPPANDAPSAPPPPGATDKIAAFIESAGQRRVTKKKVESEETNAQLQMLTFEIAEEAYAIDIEKVVEIVTPRAITRVPNADPSVVGILSLRGAVVTLIDARARLGHGSSEHQPGPDAAVIVAQFDRDLLGFLVDRVHRVVKIDGDAVQPHPVVHASEQDESVRGVFRHGESLTILLDLERLLGTHV